MAKNETDETEGGETAERERFKGLVLKSKPSDEAEQVLAKISVVGGTDINGVADFVKKSLTEVRKQHPTAKFIKGTLTIS